MPGAAITAEFPLLLPSDGVYGGASASAGEWVMFCGGVTAGGVTSNRMNVKNLATARLGLGSGSPMLHPRKSHSAGGAVAIDGKAYFFAAGDDTLGSPASTSVERVIIEPGFFGPPFEVAQLNSSRSQMGMAGADYDPSGQGGYVVIAGGYDNIGGPIAEVILIDVFNGTLTTLHSLDVPRYAPIVAAYGGTFVVTGGFESGGVPSRTVDVFRNQGSVWGYSSGPTLTIPRARHAVGVRPVSATSLELLAAGGSTYPTSVDILRINLTSGAVSPFSGRALSVGRANLVGGCSVVGSLSSAPYSCIFVGGNTATGAVDTVDVIDLSGNVISTGRLPTPVTEAFGAMPPSVGALVIAGGKTNGGFVSSVYAFGAMLSSIRLDNALATPKAFLAAASGDGQVWFGGGCTAASVTSCAAPDDSIARFSLRAVNVAQVWQRLSRGRSHLAAAYAAGIVVFAGGLATTAEPAVDCFNSTTGLVLTQCPSLSVARWGLAGAASGPFVIFSGGFDDLQRPLADIDVFQAAGAGLQRRSAGPSTGFIARGLFAAVMIDDLLPILMVAGGDGGGQAISWSASPFDAFQAASSPTLASNATAVSGFLLGGSTVVFVGGYAGSIGAATYTSNNNVQIDYYDGAQPQARASGAYYFVPVAFAAAASLETEGVGMVTGGGTADAAVTDVVGLCDSGFWALQHLQVGRRYHAMGAVGGYFIIAGGADGNGNPLDSVEYFKIPTTTACVGVSPFAGAVCVGGLWTIPVGTVLSPPVIIINPGQTITVAGTLILLPTTDTQIAYDPSTGAPIIVSGSVSLNGSLTITLDTTVKDGTLIPIVTGTGAVDGEFTTITVSGRSCQTLRGEARGLSVLVSVVKDTCKRGGGLPKGAIIGIVIGTVLFAALVVVLLWRLRTRSPTGFLFNSTRRDSMTGVR